MGKLSRKTGVNQMNSWKSSPSQEQYVGKGGMGLSPSSTECSQTGDSTQGRSDSRTKTRSKCGKDALPSKNLRCTQMIYKISLLEK